MGVCNNASRLPSHFFSSSLAGARVHPQPAGETAGSGEEIGCSTLVRICRKVTAWSLSAPKRPRCLAWLPAISSIAAPVSCSVWFEFVEDGTRGPDSWTAAGTKGVPHRRSPLRRLFPDRDAQNILPYAAGRPSEPDTHGASRQVGGRPPSRAGDSSRNCLVPARTARTEWPPSG